jgi:hypothetical protein
VDDFPDVRYAVIEVLQTETGHERIVIAYPNEKSLRDLIAAPSIVAFGFASREEAMVSGGASTAAADHRAPGIMVGAETNRRRDRPNWHCGGETGSMLQDVKRFLSTSCSDVVTLTTVILSSTNFVLTAIRMALGSSV